METREEYSEEKNSLGAGSWSPLKEYTHKIIFELSAENETLTQWEKLTVCCPQALDPRLAGIRTLMMLMSTHLITNQSKECPRADHTLFEPLLSNFLLPPPDGDTQF